ncbi:MFS transporter (macronuclear) [Tetrahymena thermophila SB210]|uniref:MFS transporter n=1 Tax=Tetrahymena thermophila (strain SB210) TaxID=312017 RepID=Q22HI3_TETTS|nr:MFS transporter [Tetrahymena thermophila SB210]EAR84718.2 MFS transporter [Tetrahymena thermophila SB210]|eukprot:XP_001032381.2 MFS transporter [Tetrahymena thermophila SB210]
MGSRTPKKEFAFEDDDVIENNSYSIKSKQNYKKKQITQKTTKSTNREYKNCAKLSKIPEQYGEDQSQSSAAEKQRAAKMKEYISSLIDQPQQLRYDSLNTIQEWAYSVGHFMNDLTAACWFNYLLYWLKQVLQFQYASWSMLSGQIFDAISTPLVGYLSDKTNTRFGKRMPWYIIGTVLVLIGFLPVFHCFIPGKIWLSLDDNNSLKAFYYIFFPSLFNVGWAAVQISHMSLVPSLTVSRKRRDSLNNKRNTFTFIANLIVLISALILFQTVPDSLIDFELLGCIVIAIGCLTQLFFIVCINEKKLTQECDKCTNNIKKILSSASLALPQRETQIFDRERGKVISVNECLSYDEDNPDHEEQHKSWKQWLKEREFYHYAFVYMGCRLYCNIISTMINFYLVYVLRIATEEEISDSTPMEIALIPLLLFISSVLMSSTLDQLYQKIGKRKVFSIGAVLMIVSSTFLTFVDVETGYLMYPIAILIGCSQVMLLNTGITLISDVIGLKGKSGAFVFGAYSFMDKISTGIALFFISESPYFKSESFIRWVTVLVPLISGLFAWLLVMTGSIKDNLSETQESEESDSEDSQYIIPKKNPRISSLSADNEDEENEDSFEKNKNFQQFIENIKKEFAN